MNVLEIVGCPDCPIGREARLRVFSDEFWLNAWYAILPFAVILLAVGWFSGRIDEGGADADDGGA
jgi:hypothetical protein